MLPMSPSSLSPPVPPSLSFSIYLSIYVEQVSRWRNIKPRREIRK
uniref:Uncharacterized protein n=1 Tax=Rhizophora mucronata TaxID=61149 RepID=A0A2P2MCK7_RHIMU